MESTAPFVTPGILDGNGVTFQGAISVVTLVRELVESCEVV